MKIDLANSVLTLTDPRQDTGSQTGSQGIEAFDHSPVILGDADDGAEYPLLVFLQGEFLLDRRFRGETVMEVVDDGIRIQPGCHEKPAEAVACDSPDPGVQVADRVSAQPLDHFRENLLSQVLGRGCVTETLHAEAVDRVAVGGDIFAVSLA